MNTPTEDGIDLARKLAGFSGHWQPRTVATFNGHDVMVVKVQGEFVWHSHAEEDELFFVLQGTLVIELRDGAVTLAPGEMAVIPKGMEHRPVAAEEVHLMLIEPKGIRHTGDVVSELTVHEYSRI